MDEAFGLAVGARSVDACSLVGDRECAAGMGEAVSVEAWAVVGEYAAGGDTQTLEVG